MRRSDGGYATMSASRELADRFGVSPRTVVRMVAEERTAYEDRSRSVGTNRRAAPSRAQGVRDRA
ncbi:hypothetical protein GCM10018773_65920 [Streptomyces candidus]|nr:hypothetical protein GCM10018773_65920 [Streptomyces candidus]